MRSILISNIVTRRLWIAGLFCLPATYIAIYISWTNNFEASSDAHATQAGTPVSTPSTPDLAQLAKLFGEPIQSKPSELPSQESSLSLKLVASYVTGSQGHSGAVLEKNDNSQHLYFQGDLIMPGVELISVHSNQVQIRRNGVIETISLLERTDEFSPQRGVFENENTQRLASRQPSAEESIVEGHELLMERLVRLRQTSTNKN